MGGAIASKTMTETIDTSDNAISIGFYMPADGMFPDDLRVRFVAPRASGLSVALDGPVSAIPGIKVADVAALLQVCRDALVASGGYA